jgi:hypothetical protein
MKKLAFLFFGHMRSYRFTHQSFSTIMSNLSKEYDCDTFIHTWDELEAPTRSHHDANLRTPHEIVDKSEIVSLYNPVDILIETQVIENPNKVIFHNQCEEGVLYAQYSRYMVNELKKQYEKLNNFKYDVVIMSRPDIIYYQKFLDSELKSPELLWLGQVYLGGASDIVYFSSSENIDSACEFYKHFNSTPKSHNLETTWENYLNTLKINKKVSKYCMPRDWKITRSWWGEDKNPSPGHPTDLIWDRPTGTKEINENEFYKYFRREEREDK